MFAVPAISLVTVALAVVGLTGLGASIFTSTTLVQFSPLTPTLSCRQFSKFEPPLLGSSWANVSLTSEANCTNPNAYAVKIGEASIRSITIRPANGSSFDVPIGNMTISSGLFPENSGEGQLHSSMTLAVPTELAVESIFKSNFQVVFQRDFDASAYASMLGWPFETTARTSRYCGFEASLQHNAVGHTSCATSIDELVVPGLSLVGRWGVSQPATAFNLGLNEALLRPMKEARLLCACVLLPILLVFVTFLPLGLAFRRLRREASESRHVELSSPKHIDSENPVV